MLRRMRLHDRMHDGVGLFHRLGPVHLHAIARQAGLQALEQLGQPRQRARAHPVTEGSQALALILVRELGSALGHQEVHRTAKVATQLSIGQRLTHVALELDRCLGHVGRAAHVTSLRYVAAGSSQGAHRAGTSPCFSKRAVDVDQAATVGTHHLGRARALQRLGLVLHHQRPKCRACAR
jgi:hypothetical protein